MRPQRRRAHVRQHGLRAQERRLQVDGDGAVEVGLGEIVQAAADGHAGVVDEQIHAADLVVDGGNHALHRPAVGNIGANCNSPTAELAHGIRHCHSLLLPLAVVHGHVGTGSSQRQGDGLADAARRPRDESDAAGEISRGGHRATPWSVSPQVALRCRWCRVAPDLGIPIGLIVRPQ